MPFAYDVPAFGLRQPPSLLTSCIKNMLFALGYTVLVDETSLLMCISNSRATGLKYLQLIFFLMGVLTEFLKRLLFLQPIKIIKTSWHTILK